jgi:hypothetical protein
MVKVNTVLTMGIGMLLVIAHLNVSQKLFTTVGMFGFFSGAVILKHLKPSFPQDLLGN